MDVIENSSESYGSEEERLPRVPFSIYEVPARLLFQRTPGRVFMHIKHRWISDPPVIRQMRLAKLLPALVAETQFLIIGNQKF
jgi:hypothetical protein